MKQQKSILKTVADRRTNAEKNKNAMQDLLLMFEEIQALKTDSVRNQKYEKASYVRDLELDVKSKISRIISFIKKEKNKIDKL